SPERRPIAWVCYTVSAYQFCPPIAFNEQNSNRDVRSRWIFPLPARLRDFSNTEDTMPDSKEWSFSYQELAAMMIQRAGLREGHWAIMLRFNTQGLNMAVNGKMVPAVVTEVVEIGLQRADSSHDLAVDGGRVQHLTHERQAHGPFVGEDVNVVATPRGDVEDAKR